MGKNNRRSPNKHCLPVESPYSTITAPKDLHERNLQIRPLTTPQGRTGVPLPIAKPKKKAQTNVVRKVGLGAFGSEGKKALVEALTGGSVNVTTKENGGLTNLQLSIQAVLTAKAKAATAPTLPLPPPTPIVTPPAPVVKSTPVQIEEHLARSKAQKEAAQRLKSQFLASQQEENAANVKKEQVEVGYATDDEDDDEIELAISKLLTPKSRPQPTFSLPPSSLFPSTSTFHSIQIAGSPIPTFVHITNKSVATPIAILAGSKVVEGRSYSGAVPDVEMEEEDPLEIIKSGATREENNLAAELGINVWTDRGTSMNLTGDGEGEGDAMDIDGMFPNPQLPSPAPASSQTREYSPELVVKPFVTAPSPKPSATPSTTQDSTTIPIVEKGPPPLVKSATKIIAGRRRKSRPQAKRRTAALFDYLSDDSDDWEDLPSSKKRPVGGKAMDGKDMGWSTERVLEAELLGSGGKEKELLPASKANKEKLIPTSYQSALVETAKTHNIITVLPTGSGKTLVAVIVMDWMHVEVEAPRIASGGKKKLQFFLVNSVPLVHQQANILAHNSGMRVGKLFGALGVNLSNTEEWAFNFENYDCLVLTAQLLLDSLSHGFISMSQISMLVLDECHHARSNHPFACILRDFYGRASSQQRPRILGMTASPLDNSEGIKAAQRLEKLLNARLVTAPAHTMSDLRERVNKPTEWEVSYAPPPKYLPSELFTKIQKVVKFKDEEFEKCTRSAELILSVYGPDASDLVWQIALAKYLAKISAIDDDSEDMPGIDMESLGTTSDFEMSRPKSGKEVEPPVVAMEEEDVAPKLPEWLDLIRTHKLSPEVKNLSPKLLALVRQLEAFSGGASASFCGIVFVNRRLDALIIAQILRMLSRGNPKLEWIRVKCVTGHGTSQSRALGPRMMWAEQAEVLTDFGEGLCNLLIATSVVEEGLDVQPCNFVARFDLYDTHISMVQSRGRARCAGSHYFLFVQRGSENEQRKIAQIKAFDEQVDHLLNKVETDYDPDYGDDEENPEDFMIDPSTDALLTPHFSIALLYRYCHSLPQSDAFNTNKPIFDFEELDDAGEVGYRCKISLPISAQIRTVISDTCSSQKHAKRKASFTACKLLRFCGALDDHFLPERTFPAEELQDEEGRALGSRKRQITYPKKLAEAWTAPEPFGETSRLYGTFIKFAGPGGTMTIRGELYSPMVLLSRRQLPPTPPLKLFIEGQEFFVSALPLATDFVLSAAQRAILLGYTLRIFASVLNRLFSCPEDDVLYYIAMPLGNSHDAGISVDTLDWSNMEYAAKVKESDLDLKSLTNETLINSVIVDEGKNLCRYFYHAIHFDLHPDSKLPPGRQSDAGFETVLDYYLSFNEPLFHKKNIKMDQPLLELTRIPKTCSYLVPTPRNDVTPSPKKLLQKTPRFAIPQLCARHSLPSSSFRSQLMLPSIITELDQLFLCQELNAGLFDNKVDLSLVRQALTTPSACREDSYERLELLGDAVLKYISSIFVFVSLPKSAHEGALHQERLRHIQNATLYQAGFHLDLPKYLVSRPFTSRLFVPANFELLRGKQPTAEAVISDKTIADVCEGLIGAAFESGIYKPGGSLTAGFLYALDTLLALKADFRGVTSWGDFSRLFGSLGEKDSVAEETSFVEAKLNHKFNHSYLLVEALTHPSKLDAHASFQRLEWLGDALLDLSAVSYVYNRWGGTLPPGHLTELKGAMCSNETLSALAVELELDPYLAFDNPALLKSLQVYKKKLVRAKELELQEALEQGRERRPYWLLLDAPKAVADIIESLFGAVFLDSNFDPEVPQRTFDHLLAPFFEEWISPTKLRIDAIRVLLETAQAAACDDVSHISSTVDGYITELGEVFPRVNKMSVIAHEKLLATVLSPNSKTAKRLVSAEAMVFLQQNPSFFAHFCDCGQKRAEKKEAEAEELERRRNEGLISEDEESDSDDDDDDSLNRDGKHLEDEMVL